ncbi:LysR family transcriptional regulator [Pontivivens insulae]|nr:LysR family transcriptional regulator [Pontivivens insulae]
MGKSLPPLTWFRSFEAAARTLSFTAAADEIGLTQSAVSQQVRALESRLGVALFMRRARGISLTDHGRRLQPQVEQALETLASAAGAFGPDQTSGVLNVATSVSVAQWVIAPNLPEFTAMFPDLRIRLLSTVWPDDFHASTADVQIRFGSRAQVGLNAEALEPSRLVALRSPMLQGDLAEVPLIETVGTSVGWRDWPILDGGPLVPSLYTDTYGMALQLAAQGNGVALVSELLASHAIATEQVVRVTEQTLAGREGYYLSIAEGNPAAADFRTWLMDVLNR